MQGASIQFCNGAITDRAEVTLKRSDAAPLRPTWLYPDFQVARNSQKDISKNMLTAIY
jgi:hypothetical protein